MKILVPQGIGDSVWCLFKVQDLVAKKGDGVIDLLVAAWYDNPMESRAVDFLRKFKFVHSANVFIMPRRINEGPVLQPGPPADENGYYRYIPDGPDAQIGDFDYALMPNAPLEKGIRLENWLPEIATNWKIMDDFVFTQQEEDFGNDFKRKMGNYVIFFMASLDGNTSSGHNRNALWTNKEWIELGEMLHARYNVNIVVVGTTWDESYYEYKIKPFVHTKPHWHNTISTWPIGHTLSVVKRSSLMVSYQSGLGNVAHYMGKPLAMFWRPKGDSISSHHYVSFEESMASAWARPDFLKRNLLLPCVYGKHKVNDILEFAKKHL